MNAGSSRSHCVVYLLVEKSFPDGRVEFGKLALVVRGCSARLAGCSSCRSAHDVSSLRAMAASCRASVLHALTRCLPGMHAQDLAGSERQEKTGAQGLTATEGVLINKSLSCLGNVVNALTDAKHKGHIPYRQALRTSKIKL